MIHSIQQGTVLIYTMVLIVLSVFMGVAVLNTVVQLESDAQSNDISISLSSEVDTKGKYLLAYEQWLNNSGSGFVDNIGCPTDFSMSGTTAISSNISSTLVHLPGGFRCQATHDGNTFYINFNDDYTDLDSLGYIGYSFSVNSSNLTATLGDPDSTFVDFTASYPLLPDGYDDNFDDDDGSPIMSGGTVAYPDGYIDNDLDARLSIYGYIPPKTGTGQFQSFSGENAYWINEDVRDSLAAEITHTGAGLNNISNSSAATVYLKDMDQDYIVSIYELDRQAYIDTKSIVIVDVVQGVVQVEGNGYLQDNGNIDKSVTGNEYVFDFQNKDYAIFIENQGDELLTYEILAEDNATSDQLFLHNFYLNTLIESSETGGFIGRQDETSYSNNGLIASVSGPITPPPSGSNIVVFSAGDNMDDISVTGFDTSGFTLNIDDFYSDLTSDTYIVHTSANNYLRLLTTGRLRIVVRDSSDSIVINKVLDVGDALVANTYYDIDLIVTATGYDVLIDGVSKASGTYSAVSAFKLPLDINNNGGGQTFRTSGIQYLDGVGATIFEENGNAVSWNAVLTNGAVEDYVPPNVVRFETGDKIEGISTSGFDTSGYSIEIEGFVKKEAESISILQSGWNTYLRFWSNGNAYAKGEDGSGTTVINSAAGYPFSMGLDESYDISMDVTSAGYSVVINGVTEMSDTFSGSISSFTLPTDLNHHNSGDFEISSLVYKDGVGAVIFAEDGTAADWNAHLTSGTVTDVTGGGDTTSPVLAQVTPVLTPGSDDTPSYTFSSDEAGSISYGGSCSSATTSASTGNNTITFSTLSDGTYGSCTISVTDASTNVSDTLDVNSFVVDTAAPTIPHSLTAGTISSTSIEFSFSGSTDTGAGVDFYNIYRDSSIVGSGATLTYTDSGLTASTSYSYSVSAVDNAGNESSESTAMVASTIAGGSNIVAFETGDKLVSLSTSGFDDSGFSISVKGLKPLVNAETFVLGTGFDSYFAFSTSNRLRLRAEGTDGTVAFDIFVSDIDMGSTYDIDFIVDSTSYEAIVDGVTTATGTFTTVGDYKMPGIINGVSAGSSSRSGDFEIEELTYKDGAGVTIFQENGDAASWNTQLTHGAVTDVVEGNIVRFETGDKIYGISKTGFDTSGFTIEMNDFTPKEAEFTSLLQVGWDTYLRIGSDGRINLRVIDNSGNLVFSTHTFSELLLVVDTSYDILVTVTSSSYDITVDGTSIKSGTFTANTDINLPIHINGPNSGTSTTHSGDFEIGSFIYKDGAGVTIFEEDGNAASWNTHLTNGAVTDI